MAGLAVIACRNVTERLARSSKPVVTGDAGGLGSCMIEYLDLPVRNAVTIGTFGGTWDMRFWSARRDIAIVACKAPGRER